MAKKKSAAALEKSPVPEKEGWYLCDYKSPSNNSNGPRVRYVAHGDLMEFPGGQPLVIRCYSGFREMQPMAADACSASEVVDILQKQVVSHTNSIVDKAARLEAERDEALALAAGMLEDVVSFRATRRLQQLAGG